MREVRRSLVYRAFCRIDGERVQDAKTLIRLARLLDEPVLKDVLARLVALGRERRLVRCRRQRLDTTVVEHPACDTVRALADPLPDPPQGAREHPDSVGQVRGVGGVRNVGFEIAECSRTAGRQVSSAVREQSKAKMKVLYQGLMRIRRAVVRQAEPAVTRARGRRDAAPLPAAIELVRQILAQTRARVLRVSTGTPNSPPPGSLRGLGGADEAGFELVLEPGRYRGESGMQRWIGLGIITNDLLVLDRTGPWTAWALT